MEKQVIKDALWVDVGDYTVLRNGRIFKRNWHRSGKTREVKQHHTKDGYLQFECNRKKVLSHRFIACAFISNPDNLPQINHKDEFRKDKNDVFSIEWCDNDYNHNYGTHNERVGKANTNGKKSKKVYQYTLSGEFVREWPSTQEVVRQLGYSSNSLINRCCNGKGKSAYGFKWSYSPPSSRTSGR